MADDRRYGSHAPACQLIAVLLPHDFRVWKTLCVMGLIEMIEHRLLLLSPTWFISAGSVDAAAAVVPVVFINIARPSCVYNVHIIIMFVCLNDYHINLYSLFLFYPELPLKRRFAISCRTLSFFSFSTQNCQSIILFECNRLR